MAHAVSTKLSLIEVSARLFSTLAARFEKYVEYRKTLNELESLSARELADLGLSGHTAKQLAKIAIYGGQL